MNPLACFSGVEWARLVHALIHSLWIGALLAAGLAAALKSIPSRRTDLRYGIAVVTMILMMLCVLGSWAAPGQRTARAANHPARQAAAQTARTETAQPPGMPPVIGMHAAVTAGSTSQLQIEWTAWFAGLWLAGVALMLARVIVALAGAGRLRRCSRPVEPAVAAIGEALRRSIGIGRRVSVAVCDRIAAPAAMGILRPLILIPASIITSIPPEQLQAVLAHELAHIRRHDYAVNIAQMIFEALLFFNPAAWWMSRQIRREREACCDALAAAALGGGIDYAQALADCAIGLRGARQLAMQGFAGRDSSLLDRILRLTSPDYRPRLRLPWHGLVMVMLIAVVALACLKKGTDKAVEIAGKFLSTEQVDQMESVQRQYGLSSKFADSDTTYTISARILTSDGRELPRNTSIMINEETSHGSSYATICKKKENTFHFDAHLGTVTVFARAPGYAPTRFGPVRHTTTEPLSFDLVLKPGYKARVRMLDPGDRPLSGVKITGYFTEMGAHVFNLTTGKDGIAALDGLSSAPLTLNASVHGYQSSAQVKLSLAAGQTFDWKLQPARITRVKVVDSATSRPVSGAKLCLVGQMAPDYNFGANGETVAVTGEEGVAALDTLDDRFVYFYFVDKPGYRREKILDVASGKPDILVALRPPIVVKGRVIGAGKLRQYWGKRMRIDANQRFDMTGFVNSVHLEVPVSDSGEFTIDRLWEGELSLNGAGVWRRFDVRGPVQEVTLDLTTTNQEVRQTTRTVAIQFDLPPSAPQPRGALSVEYIGIEDGQRTTKPKTVPIKDGEARIVVPVPTTLQLRPISTIGYWFKRDYQGYQIPDEPGVFAIKLPATPAGTIFGKVVEADGTPASGLLISALEIEKSPARPEGSFDGDIKSSASGSSDMVNTFSAGFLPLDGTYAIVVHHGETYVMSEPIKLTQEKPIRELTIMMPVGITVEGRVLTPDGQPVSLPMELNIQTKYSHGFGSNQATDPLGRFRFEHVNPNFPGTMSLILKPKSQWQADRVVIKPDGRPLEIRLKPGKVITGQVMNIETGEPIRGVTAKAYQYDPWSEHEADAPTGADGRFRISTLGDGEYNMLFSPPADGPLYSFSGAKATAGQSQPIILQLRPVRKK